LSDQLDEGGFENEPTTDSNQTREVGEKKKNEA